MYIYIYTYEGVGFEVNPRIVLLGREAPDPPVQHPRPRRGQIVFFNCLDLYLRPPVSGKRQYKSRELEKGV